MSKQLYSVAREFAIWTKPDGYLGYPFGWSPIRSTTTPPRSPAPDSWDVLLDPKYKGRVVVEDQPEEIVAYMGKLAGVANAYSMTDDELGKAKDLLEQVKPNILRLAHQASDTSTR